MFKIELENRDFRKSLYFYTVDAGKNGLRGASYIVDAGKNGLRAFVSALIYISRQSVLKQGFQKTHFPMLVKLETLFAVD